MSYSPLKIPPRNLSWIFLTIFLAIHSAPAAFAHVVLTPNSVGLNEYSTLTFWVYHGCDDASTTRLTVQIPDGVLGIIPQMKAGWELTTEKVDFPEPLVISGTEIPFAVTEVTWSGGPIPTEFMDAFVMGAFFPQRAGEKYRFFVEQECVDVDEPAEWAPEVSVVESVDSAGGGDSSTPALILGGLGLVVGLVALGLVILGRRRP